MKHRCSHTESIVFSDALTDVVVGDGEGAREELFAQCGHRAVCLHRRDCQVERLDEVRIQREDEAEFISRQ